VKEQQLETVEKNRCEISGETALLAGRGNALPIKSEMGKQLRDLCVLSVLNFAPRRVGSMEEYLAHLANEIGRFGGRSVVAVSEPPAPDVAAMFENAGVFVEILPFEPSGAADTKALERLLEKYAPGVVHLHHLPLVCPAIYAAGKHGAKVFVSEHKSIIPMTVSFLRRKVLHLCVSWYCRSVQRFIAPSEFIRQYLIREQNLDPERVVTIHNGVNLDRHHPHKSEPIDIRTRYGLSSTEHIVIHIAFAHKYKGIDDFVRSASVLKEKGLSFRHFVVGDGARMDDYKALAKELNCMDRIIFTGLVDQPTIDSLLGQCDVSALACTWGEAFSLAVLESMARGKAMVATSVGGTPEAIIDGDTGLLVPPGDWRQLGEAIATLLQDNDLRCRMGANARKRAEVHFDVQQWVRRTLELYVSNNLDIGDMQR
jgi:glycosyltransferase involved in cell wall biosynthesis